MTPAGEPSGAVDIGGSRNFSLEGCSFAHVGAAYGLSIGALAPGTDCAHAKSEGTRNREASCTASVINT